MLSDRRAGASRRHRAAVVCVFLLGTLGAAGALADADRDRQDITAMLADFLANVGDVAVHERFWADDLVYTSSSGTRFGKQDILDGMRGAPPEDPDAPQVVYSGRDVDVRLFGDMAVLAFRLVATSGDEVADSTEQFFNTGTLVRRDGRWQVVAWQATRIPSGDAADD